MAKYAYVWNSGTSSWESLATQLPKVPVATQSGSQSVTITANPTTAVVSLGSGTFTVAPLIFTQLTSTAGVTISVTAKTTTSFTVSIAGQTSGTATFDWFAVQQTA